MFLFISKFVGICIHTLFHYIKTKTSGECQRSKILLTTYAYTFVFDNMAWAATVSVMNS